MGIEQRRNVNINKRGGTSGWFKESYRHYLAAKGVSTKRYYRIRPGKTLAEIELQRAMVEVEEVTPEQREALMRRLRDLQQKYARDVAGIPGPVVMRPTEEFLGDMAARMHAEQEQYLAARERRAHTEDVRDDYANQKESFDLLHARMLSELERAGVEGETLELLQAHLRAGDMASFRYIVERAGVKTPELEELLEERGVLQGQYGDYKEVVKALAEARRQVREADTEYHLLRGAVRQELPVAKLTNEQLVRLARPGIAYAKDPESGVRYRVLTEAQQELLEQIKADPGVREQVIAEIPKERVQKGVLKVHAYPLGMPEPPLTVTPREQLLQQYEAALQRLAEREERRRKAFGVGEEFQTEPVPGRLTRMPVEDAVAQRKRLRDLVRRSKAQDPQLGLVQMIEAGVVSFKDPKEVRWLADKPEYAPWRERLLAVAEGKSLRPDKDKVVRMIEEGVFTFEPAELRQVAARPDYAPWRERLLAVAAGTPTPPARHPLPPERAPAPKPKKELEPFFSLKERQNVQRVDGIVGSVARFGEQLFPESAAAGRRFTGATWESVRAGDFTEEVAAKGRELPFTSVDRGAGFAERLWRKPALQSVEQPQQVEEEGR